MSDETKPFNKPWLVTVWPGMGQVAINAGHYMIAKLEMRAFAEFTPDDLFDVDHVDVEAGIIHEGKLPSSRCFVWRDPKKKRDIILFIGEAQPASGKRAFCQALVRLAKSLDVERIVTFSAMATKMHPEKASRVFGAATNTESLAELTRLGANVLEEGHIDGLNGAVLGVAAASGLPGTCLLGEIPELFSQFPFPSAALAVLRLFSTLAQVSIDLDELVERSDELGSHLGRFLIQVDASLKGGFQPNEDSDEFEQDSEKLLSDKDQRLLDVLFASAREDRSKAFELKRELDRLGVFPDYEDAFLDLFQRPVT